MNALSEARLRIEREKAQAKLRKILFDLASILNINAIGDVGVLKHCCSTMLSAIDKLKNYDSRSDNWIDELIKDIRNGN